MKNIDYCRFNKALSEIMHEMEQNEFWKESEMFIKTELDTDEALNESDDLEGLKHNDEGEQGMGEIAMDLKDEVIKKEHVEDSVQEDKKDGVLVCNICEMKFTKKNSLDRHMKRKHAANEMYKCDICAKVSPNYLSV